MFRSHDLNLMGANIDLCTYHIRQMEQPFFSHDKPILFDLVYFAPKQLNPTGSERELF